MRIMSGKTDGEVVIIGMDPGEMLLETIKKAITEKGIGNGVVISGIGTLKNLRMHYIKHTDCPPAEESVNIERPLELLSVSGVIADSDPHLHVVVSCGRNEVYAGHLEPNSEIAYLAEIAILVTNDIEMIRRMDEKRKIRLLQKK